MKIAIIKLGSRISISSNDSSGGTGETLAIINMLITAGIEVDAFTKVFEESVFTALPNLIGAPALVSGGVQLMGKHFDESVLLSLANSVERKGE